MMVRQALFSKILACVRYLRFSWEKHLSRVQYRLVPNDCHLRLIMAKGLHPEKQFVKNHTNGPNIDFASNFRIAQVETLRRLVPIRAHTLRSEFNLVLALLKRFAQSKVGYLDLTLVE